MRYVLILAALVSAGLLLLLTTASENSPLFADYFPVLMIVAGSLVVGLLVLAGYQLVRLRRRIRHGVFGSKLTSKLLLWFSLVALLPGAVVYGASVFFLNRSIETWFDVRVDKALGAGVNLGQAVLDDLLRETRKKAERIAIALSDEGAGSVITMLSALREQGGVQELTLFDDMGRVVATAGNENSGLLPQVPDKSLLWRVRQQETYSRVDALPDGDLVMRVLVPVYSTSFGGETRVLQVLQAVPSRLGEDAELVQAAYGDYQEIAVSRLGIKRLYGIALTLTLIVALLFTFALSYWLSDRLGAPLRTLVRGTRAVAQGDFSQMRPVNNRDELGTLIHSFNRMTRQLAEARSEVERNHLQTQQAKAYLETVLGALSSGVITLDEKLRVRSANASALSLLGATESGLVDRELLDWGPRDSPLDSFGHALHTYLMGQSTWEHQVPFSDGQQNRIFLVRGSPLPDRVAAGYTLVFDDMTTLIHAERDAAWAEVARRLAHEIKNPLTPIQLSAERLAFKLADKLPVPEQEMLIRSTSTIVNQVAAMKSMVDAFANYARLPRAQLARLDLNALVRDVLSLYDGSGAGIRLLLADNLPAIRGDATLLRQVIHNLLQNAQDALHGQPDPQITLLTREGAGVVNLTLTDNGPGFPETLRNRLFEPYATTKPKGTGLGLAIVKKIIEEHHGHIHVENLEPCGARISIDLPFPREKVTS
jgi:nitrogen fixation/metabolism regulation signal transduction histidine kinase